MISKYAPKRENQLIKKCNIKEELKLIDETNDYYITKSGKIYRLYQEDKFYLIKNYKNKRNGYLYVTLIINGKHKSFRLHRLVAIYFIENPNKFPVVGHKDNNRANPDVSNLYWTTYKENTQKAVSENRLVNAKGYNDSQSIPVIAYDSNHNEIGRYGSASECHKNLGVSKSTIFRHCNHEIKGKSRCGYYFEYE